MKADEIRKLERPESFDYSGYYMFIGDMLQEIAAQLAELNSSHIAERSDAGCDGTIYDKLT